MLQKPLASGEVDKVTLITQLISKHQEQKEAFLKACTLARRTAETFLKYSNRSLQFFNQPTQSTFKGPEAKVKGKTFFFIITLPARKSTSSARQRCRNVRILSKNSLNDDNTSELKLKWRVFQSVHQIKGPEVKVKGKAEQKLRVIITKLSNFKSHFLLVS